MGFALAENIGAAAALVKSEFRRSYGQSLLYSNWYDGTNETEQQVLNKWKMACNPEEDRLPEDDNAFVEECSEILIYIDLAIEQLEAQGYLRIYVLGEFLVDGEPNYRITLTTKGICWLNAEASALAPKFVDIDM